MSNLNHINEKIQQQVGSNIRQLRISKGVAQRDLAAWCNFESSNLSRIENGRTNLTLSNLYKIAKALDVNITELLQGL